MIKKPIKKLNKHIQEYIDIVRSGEFAVCEEQLLLCDFVEKVFREEDIRVDEEQLEKYLTYQKYFPFELFPWERFCFALHNCTFRADGQPRFMHLFIFGGRSLGKNGYLGFEDFCLLTPTHGIRNYHIDIFAMSEEQAKRSWEDVYEILERNSQKMKGHFYWTKEVIVNKHTRSKYAYNTSAPKTKDSSRPGKVNIDEIHGYENGKLINVVTSGLDKVSMARRTTISTNGDIRGDPLDSLIDISIDVLSGKSDDNGLLPFICRLDNDDEIHNPKMWHKANPSLRYMPNLLEGLKRHYQDYLNDPIVNSGFVTKRLNRPQGEKENAVATDENIERALQPFDENDLRGLPCVAGFDYARTNDFLGVGLLYMLNKNYIWVTHTFVCEKSADLFRIKAPIREWAARGLLTFVNAEEIPPDLPVAWAVNKAAELKSPILRAGIDSFRSHWLRRALDEYGFHDNQKDYKRIFTVRPQTEMRFVPVISSAFINNQIIFGDNPLMRWSVHNTKISMSSKGNITYDKIEPKSRKTDPFKAFVQAVCAAEDLLDRRGSGNLSIKDLPGVITF